jgi:hypothetical protein
MLVLASVIRARCATMSTRSHDGFTYPEIAMTLGVIGVLLLLEFLYLCDVNLGQWTLSLFREWVHM